MLEARVGAGAVHRSDYYSSLLCKWLEEQIVPVFSSFRDVASYYNLLFHEGLHATAAKHRLDRDLSGRFGSEAYDMEEIIVIIALSAFFDPGSAV
ncbi:MAG: hypothetical protein E5X53_33420 [Mesorhizobium sp.]|nr:MAG: hypothetical protein E5X55_31345 [Mesorhizobium sp.]TIR47583.1 MAG: hypothetical protein E5X53_33420 [Mesorhizobium sp.]TJV93360.1 MAG: hypothetical protein E5X52_31875 [Mesorhizobium sp.]